MTDKVKIPAWTEEREAQLLAAVDGETQPLTQEVIAVIAEDLGTTPRSVSSKLRNIGGYDIESAAAAAKAKSFSQEEEDRLVAFVEANAGQFTFAEIAEQVFGGSKTARQVQGKLLSLDLTDSVKPTEKVTAPLQYTEAETAEIVKMIEAGKCLEEIVDVTGREINSIRGKSLSLLKQGVISKMPVQRDHKASEKPDGLTALGDVSEMTVEEIAQAIGKTVRGVKTMLTHRGIDCSNYKGAEKREKRDAAKKAEAA